MAAAPTVPAWLGARWGALGRGTGPAHDWLRPRQRSRLTIYTYGHDTALKLRLGPVWGPVYPIDREPWHISVPLPLPPPQHPTQRLYTERVSEAVPRSGWWQAARGWCAGAALLALLVLLARAADRCIHRNLLKRRRRSQEWPTQTVRATCHSVSDVPPEDAECPGLPGATPLPAPADAPPPYSACSSAPYKLHCDDIVTEEPPPPYSDCYVEYSNKGVPSVLIYARRNQQNMPTHSANYATPEHNGTREHNATYEHDNLVPEVSYDNVLVSRNNFVSERPQNREVSRNNFVEGSSNQERTGFGNNFGPELNMVREEYNSLMPERTQNLFHERRNNFVEESSRNIVQERYDFPERPQTLYEEVSRKGFVYEEPHILEVPRNNFMDERPQNLVEEVPRNNFVSGVPRIFEEIINNFRPEVPHNVSEVPGGNDVQEVQQNNDNANTEAVLRVNMNERIDFDENASIEPNLNGKGALAV